jgi:phosphoserine phosphatase
MQGRGPQPFVHMSDIFLVNLSGHDRPGLTAQVMDILARHDVNVLDIGQSVIHDTLSLALLLLVDDESEAGVLKDLVIHTSRLDVDLRLTPVSAQDYAAWVPNQQRGRYIVTLLARQLSAEHLATISHIISAQGLNIDDITRLSERQPLTSDLADGVGGQRACVQLSVSGQPLNLDTMRASFLSATAELGIDVAFQADDIYRRHRRVVVLDMDSTLVQGEIIDELAAAAGVGEQVASITAQAMNGEIDFSTSFRRRVALLKGLPASRLNEIAEQVPLTEGAERLIGTLKQLGYRVAILSGGFTYFARHLQHALGIDDVYANELDIVDGLVSGRVVGEIVDGQRKADLLQQIAAREGVRLEQVVAVGDGANDLQMLSLAGLGIAFRAKPLVRREARQSLSTVGLDGILYLMGIRDREIMG